MKDKNPQIAELCSTPEDLHLLFTKPAAPGYKTAVIATSPEIRNRIMKTGYIYIHMSRCKAYDRYWVFRCRKCMSYKHKTEKCSNENPRCGHCSNEHLSEECTNKTAPKCCHCTDNSRVDTQHSAFDTSCPSFIAARNLVVRKTMHVLEEYCTSSKNESRQNGQSAMQDHTL